MSVTTKQEKHKKTNKSVVVGVPKSSFSLLDEKC